MNSEAVARATAFLYVKVNQEDRLGTRNCKYEKVFKILKKFCNKVAPIIMKAFAIMVIIRIIISAIIYRREVCEG
mgnify:CR=1 FL=1